MKKKVKVWLSMILVLVMIFTQITPMSQVQAASKVKLSKTKITMKVGSSYTLKLKGTVRKAKWSSSNKSIASVSSKGVVTGKKAGTATIKAKVSGKTYSCKVTVNAYLNSSKVTISKGNSYTLKLKGATAASFKSSNTAVATVTKKGVINAKKKGSATITVVDKKKKKYTCKVKVEAPVLNKLELALFINQSEQLKLLGNTKHVVWTSSNPTIATVDDEGVVTAKKAGSAVITAKVGKVSYSCDVTVKSNEVESYTVYFNSNGGSYVSSQTVQKGKMLTRPADPTKAGYLFVGWYTNAALTTQYNFGNAVTYSFTLYARWELIPVEPVEGEFTVTFDSNGGTHVTTQIVPNGECANRPVDPERVGFTFVDWYADSNLTIVYDFSTPVTSDITIYAKWEQEAPTIKTITFDTNGGSSIDDQAVYSGDFVIRPEDPTKEGYVFAGWYSDASLTTPYTFDEPVYSDFTLYAAWDAARVTITLTADTTDIHEVNRVITGSATANLTITAINYTFASTNKNESGEINLADAESFSIPLELEDGQNTLTVNVTAIDGGVYSESLTMKYDAGEIIDYGHEDTIFDPEDPRIVKIPTDDSGDTSTTVVSNIINLMFAPEVSYEDRLAFIENELNATYAGSANTVNLIQAWLPTTLKAVNGYEGTLTLSEITENELLAYADAITKAYPSIDLAYIDYVYENAFEITTNDPWDGTLESSHSDPSYTHDSSNKSWWRDYVNFPEAWDYDNYYNLDFIHNITLGVMDAGFTDDHEELSGRVSIVSDRDNTDDHGTHVAGIITATANNEKGLAGGMHNNATINAYDGTESSRFSTTEIYNGLVRCVESGAKVINFSIGSAGNTSSPNYKTAEERRNSSTTASRYMATLLSKQYDFVVVQSAGNAGIDSINNGTFASLTRSSCSTASGVTVDDIMNRVLIVSAIDPNGTMASFSCGGENETHTIAAPGVDIFSCGVNRNTYAYMSGTSMAAPIVTAACGFVWAANPALKGNHVVDLITSHTNGTATTNTDSNTTGNMGILDVEASTKAAINLLPTYTGNVMNGVDSSSVAATIRLYKNSSPGTIVGTSDLIYCDSNGNFSLPKLPAGTYELEVTAPGYATTHISIRTTNSSTGESISLGVIPLSPEMGDDEYRIMLEWLGEPSDLDSHLTATTVDGDYYHVYYSDQHPSPEYANLDRDDTDYNGPETITITDFDKLRNIKYAIHDYTNRYENPSDVMSNSGAYVSIFRGNSTEAIRTFYVPANTGGTEWDVFAFDANGSIIPINTMTYCESPSNVLSSYYSSNSQAASAMALAITDEGDELKDYEK